MSASNKKKLRKEQNAEMLTQKQKEQNREAKKLKAYTIIFSSVLVVVLCVALVTLGVRFVNQSGILEKRTIAANVGGTDLNTVELTYYYNDAINNMYTQAYESFGSSYASMYLEAIGLDLSTPLDEQTNPDTGKSWAEYFVDAALSTAQSDIAMATLAAKENFTLPQEDQETLDTALKNLKTTATLSGVTVDQYLENVYGYGASEKSYTAYLKRSALADAYYDFHQDNLTYDDAAIQAKEEENPNGYNSYSYSYCYMSYTEFRQGGTKDENGSTTYTAEEDAAARAKLAEAAAKLTTATTLEDLKTMVSEIEVNESSQLAVNQEVNQLHSSTESTNAALAQWLADDARVVGEIGSVAITAKADSEDENSEDVTNGYYVVLFEGSTDNATVMGNVRHLLIAFEGGTTDETTNETVYSAEEKGVAKTEAESLLQKWQDGEATEESFIALVKEYSDDSTAADGGLFEDINPNSQYTANFLNWSIDPSRKVGDTGIIETEYGYHVMYYVGDSEHTYREYMIIQELTAADQEAWFTAATEATTITKKNLSRLRLDFVIASGV